MLLIVATILMAQPVQPMPNGSAPEPSYFADRITGNLQPITAPLDFSNDRFLSVTTPDGKLSIAFADIDSIGYLSSGTPAYPQGAKPFRNLITIGFKSQGVHHNLVVQLPGNGWRPVLRELSARTSLKVGTRRT